MAAVLEQYPEDSEQLQLHALEQTLRALCDHVAILVDDAREHESLRTREVSLQLQAFEERRSKALLFLSTEHREPCWIQSGALERLLEALDCSREFFATRVAVSYSDAASSDGPGLVR